MYPRECIVYCIIDMQIQYNPDELTRGRGLTELKAE